MAKTKEWGPFFDENDDPCYEEVLTPTGTFGVPAGHKLSFDSEGQPILKAVKVKDPTPTPLLYQDKEEE